MSTIIEPDVQQRFERLRDAWKKQSEHLSNSAQMAMLWPYQQIIGMGYSAVPLILAELRRETDHWFWALEAITGVNPVPPSAAGDVRLSAQAWLHWGREIGLTAEDA